MAKRRSVTINRKPVEVLPKARIKDVVPANTLEVHTPEGEIIPVSEFDKEVPDQLTSYATPIDKGNHKEEEQ